MGCSSLSVAKVSACHREAITMLYAITMLFYRSTHRDVRTDPWVVFPLLHSDIFVFFYFVFFSFWNSAFQNTTFSPLSDLITPLSLFPPSFTSFQIWPPPLSPSSSSARSQRCSSCLDSASPPALKTWTPRGSDDRRRANVQVTMTWADEDGAKRRLFQESRLERLSDILNFFPFVILLQKLLSRWRLGYISLPSDPRDEEISSCSKACVLLL